MTLEITFGGYQGDKSVHTRGAQSLAAAVERLTNGAARLKFRQNIVADGHKAVSYTHLTLPTNREV